MADLKMPELNSVLIAGNLTRDPIFRNTSNGTPVVNFSIASNRRYRDSSNEWQEDVCYVGIVAWNKLALSCSERLRKGSAVLVDGELQTRNLKREDGTVRSILEVKARRIQFLNRFQGHHDGNGRDVEEERHHREQDSVPESDNIFEEDDDRFDEIFGDTKDLLDFKSDTGHELDSTK
ncbi:MAG: single-stranded DNA-binding protein [Chlorobi bacterium]|nr:single-stranded DNA-binding protein [Chlorobiota bacterium]